MDSNQLATADKTQTKAIRPNTSSNKIQPQPPLFIINVIPTSSTINPSNATANHNHPTCPLTTIPAVDLLSQSTTWIKLLQQEAKCSASTDKCKESCSPKTAT